MTDEIRDTLLIVKRKGKKAPAGGDYSLPGTGYHSLRKWKDRFKPFQTALAFPNVLTSPEREWYDMCQRVNRTPNAGGTQAASLVLFMSYHAAVHLSQPTLLWYQVYRNAQQFTLC